MKFQHTGYVIKQVQQQINTAMEGALQPISLNISQYNVLKNLEANSFITGAELARRAFVTPQTMHAILTTMERKGFIDRHPINGNNKSFNISITNKGLQALKDAETALSNVFNKANASLTSKEYTDLTNLLEKLSLGLNDPE